MYFQKRGERYSFVFYDLEIRKNSRLKIQECPPIKTDEEAREFCKQWDRKHATTKSKIEEKTRWIELFPDFMKLLLTYERARKEDAPYSWHSNVYYLKYHVFDFFLCIKKELKLNRWYRFFEEFREYLQISPCIKKVNQENGTLAYSTMNGVIKSLNSFFEILYRRNVASYPFKCRMFEKSKCNQKGAESVISKGDQIRIYERLKTIDLLSAPFFFVCLHTGLRLSECLSLSLNDFFQGQTDSEALRNTLKAIDQTAHGFLSIDSQLVWKLELRNHNGELERKPLKGKKKISLANGRAIPIFNADCFNTLVSLWNKQFELFKKKVYGQNPSNYLLFDGLNKNIYSLHLREAQATLEFSRLYTPHDTRHTYSTWLAGTMGGSFELCRLVLGHSDVKTTSGYVHISEEIQLQLKTKLQLQRPMSFTSVEKKNNVIELRPARA